MAKKLAKAYKNIDALMAAGEADLMKVDEIGARIASSVVHFFSIGKNRKLIERLKSYGLQFSLSEAQLENQSDVFKGQTFVVSGVFESFSRTELKKLIEDHGGKVASSISSKTTYVVAGENMGPSKRTKADNVGVPIISEADFIAMLPD